MSRTLGFALVMRWEVGVSLVEPCHVKDSSLIIDVYRCFVLSRKIRLEAMHIML